VGLSGWFSLSVVAFSYVVGVGCSIFVLFCSVIGNKLDFSSFSGSVVGCNLEYKRSFLLSWMHSVERHGVAVLCLVCITTCPDGSPRRTVRAVDCALTFIFQVTTNNRS